MRHHLDQLRRVESSVGKTAAPVGHRQRA
jgi:hypothetical protein